MQCQENENSNGRHRNNCLWQISLESEPIRSNKFKEAEKKMCWSGGAVTQKAKMATDELERRRKKDFVLQGSITSS